MTGAGGFVGIGVVSSLLKDSEKEVVAIVRRRVKALPDHCQLELLDISNLDEFNFPDDVEIVIHLAAKIEGLSSYDEFFQENVTKTENLATLSQSKGVKRFIFLSSLKVNGEQTKSGEAFFADSTPRPEDFYGISKYEAEQRLLALASKSAMDVVIVRPPLIYGVGVKGNFALLVKLVKKVKVLPFRSIKNFRSMLALENLVDFIKLCADIKRSPKAKNEIFLISDDEDISTGDLLKKIAGAYQVNLRLFYVPHALMSFFARILGRSSLCLRLCGSLQADISKTRNYLGWKPVITMEDQLMKMAQAESEELN